MAFKMMREKRHVLIALALIAFISSIFIPGGIIYPLKWFFIPRAALEFGASPWSLVTGGIGFIVIGIGLLVLAKESRGVLSLSFAVILLLVGSYGVLLSSKDYYYMTYTDFVVNPPYSLVSKSYSWAEIETIEQVEYISQKKGKDGETVILHMRDGNSFSYGSILVWPVYSLMIEYVEEHGGEFVFSTVIK